VHARIVTLKHGTGNLYLPDDLDIVMKASQVYLFTYSDALSGWNYVGNVISVSASDVVFTPAGSIASTDVQNAIEELDSEKQPIDAGLTSISGLTTVADRMIYTTASDTYAVATITSAGRAILDDADATAQRSTLGLGSIATQASSSVSITGGSIVGLTNLGLATYTELTISTGEVTATQVFHTLDSEGDASTDDLDTITVGTSNLCLLKLADSGRIITLKDGTGNLDIGADVEMSFDTCYLLAYNGASWNIVGSTATGGSSSSNSESINQSSHGLAKYDAIYHNGTIFAKALADDVATANVVGIVSAVADTDNFTVTYAGLVAWDAPPTPDYTLGSNLFLSNVTAGLITNSTLTYVTGDVRQFVGTSLVGGLLVNISEGSEITEDTSFHSDVSGEFDALTENSSPASGSWFVFEDSADSFAKKKINVDDLGGGGSTLPVVDTTGIAKGSVDSTKIVRFEVDGLTTSTTRVITMPDNDVDLGDIATNNAKITYPSGDSTKVGYLTVTQAVDLDDIESKANSALQNIVEDTSPQLGGTLDTNSKQVRWSKGADVASATALTLGTDGNSFDVTGTTTITSINTLAVGTLSILHFDGILTLTHHATDLILPTGASITTAVGDIAVIYEYASGDWRCVSYTRADGTPLAGGGGGGGGILPSAESTKTGNYTVVSGDVGTCIILGTGASADSTFTLDVSLLADYSEVISFLNISDYQLDITVSNTGTMTIDSIRTSKPLWKGNSILTIRGGNGSTTAYTVAG
jgi:hypothetical protein